MKEELLKQMVTWLARLLVISEWVGHGCLPHQYMIGGYQCTSEVHRAGI